MNVLLSFAAVLIGALCVLNLLLTVGVIRRLKQHTDLISTMSMPPGPAVIPPGEQVGEFAARTEDGEPFGDEDFTADTFVGVFSPGCGACTEQMPAFTERAADFPGGRDQVLVVIAGPREQYAQEIVEFGRIARVIVEESNGPVTAALQVQGFPAFAHVDSSGRVLASGHTVDDTQVSAGV
jgi:hypothetical protein